MLDGGASATLERRVYARLDETLGPVNDALDAVTLRLDKLAVDYQALAALVGDSRKSSCDPDLYTAVNVQSSRFETLEAAQRTTDAVLEQQERRFGDLARRDRQVEAQLEGLAKDIVDLGTKLQDHGDLGLEPLAEKVDQLGQAVATARNVNVEQTTRIGRYGQKIEELTHARVDADTYEVDGKPATKTEYEAAERDDRAPHTTRHVHRPFSNPEPNVEVRNILWAAQQMDAGAKVRRKGWDKELSYSRNAKFKHKIVFRLSEEREQDAEILLNELLATDWELA